MSTHISGIYLLLEGDTSEINAVQYNREITWDTSTIAFKYLDDSNGNHNIYEYPSIFTNISGVNTAGIQTNQVLKYNGAEFVPSDMVAGSTDHNTLTNRNMANQHPITAINGLQTALDSKLTTVAHDATITGDGTSTHPLSVVGGGGVPASGHWNVAVIPSGEVLYNDKDYSAVIAGSTNVQPRGKLNGLIDDGGGVTQIGTCPVTGPNLITELPCHLLVAGSADGSGIGGVGNADGQYTYAGYDPNGLHGQGDHYYLLDGSNDNLGQGVWIMRVSSVWCLTYDMSPGHWTDSCYTTTALSPVNANWAARQCTGNIQVEESDGSGNYIPNVGSIGIYSNMDLLIHGSASIDRNAHIHETLLIGSGAYYDYNNMMNSSSDKKMLVPKEYLDATISGIVIPPVTHLNLSGVLNEGNDGGVQQIKNILDPTDPQDAATMNYVDTEIGNIPAGGDVTASGVSTRLNIAVFEDTTGKVISDHGFNNTGAYWNANSIQTQPVATNTPNAGEALMFDGNHWTPTAIPSGTIPNLDGVLTAGTDGGAHIISNILDPVALQDAATKNYVDTEIGNIVFPSGTLQTLASVLTVSNDGGAKQIKNILDPTVATDAATMSYVDTQISGIVIPSGNYTLQDVTDNGPYTDNTFGYENNTTKIIFGKSGVDIPTIELEDTTNIASIALISGMLTLSGDIVEVATQSNPLKGNTYHTPTDDKDYVQMKYVDTQISGIIIPSGNLLHANLTDISTNGHPASVITYSNTTSGLTAINTQAAIDEIDGLVDSNTSNIMTNTTNISNISGVYEPIISPKNTAFNKNFGTANTDVARGDHTHSINELSDVDTNTTSPVTGEVLVWDGTNWIPGVNGGIPLAGPTANRPTSPVVPTEYFDTDLGYAIWWDGTNWVNGSGAIV